MLHLLKLKLLICDIFVFSFRKILFKIKLFKFEFILIYWKLSSSLFVFLIFFKTVLFFFSLFLVRKLAFFLFFSKIMTYLEFLIFLLLNLKDKQSSSNLHTDISIWWNFNLAFWQWQCSKFRFRILKSELAIFILNMTMISRYTNVTHFQITILSSAKLIFLLNRESIQIILWM